MKVKEETEKAGLKLNIEKTKIMASSPITSRQIEEEKWKQWQILFSQVSKSLWTVTAAMKLKDTGSLEEKLWPNLEKAMAPHSSTLAWKIPWMEEPGRLQSWGRWELDTTERLPFHFSLSCIGEGNGNPLQCSCLENPMDRGAWWASVYGVAQSGTRR